MTDVPIKKIVEYYYPLIKVTSDGDKIQIFIENEDDEMKNVIKLNLNTEESQIVATTMMKLIGQIEMIQRVEANKK